MPYHHLVRNGLLAPRSSIYQLAHPERVPLCLFSKALSYVDGTCNQSYRGSHQQADVSKMFTYRSNPKCICLDSRAGQLFMPSSMKRSQPSVKFSSSLLLCSKFSKSIGNVTNSKVSPFDFFSLRSLISTPSPYMLYGISGLIPFSAIPIYIFMTSTYCPLLAHAQLVYGACILSFLGGVAWGSELKTPEMSTLISLGYSISLPLISWISVLASPSIIAFPIMISGISVAAYTDTKIQNYPQWFKNLRFLLSSIVLTSLLATFVFSLVYPNSESKEGPVEDAKWGKVYKSISLIAKLFGGCLLVCPFIYMQIQRHRARDRLEFALAEHQLLQQKLAFLLEISNSSSVEFTKNNLDIKGSELDFVASIPTVDELDEEKNHL